jgi:ABC-type transport system involved in cytochrome bd biosynthesis fused ATPase/permease subunit
MAITAITETELKLNVAKKPEALAACDATLGAEIEYNKKDDGKILIKITNADDTNAETVTIKKGTGVQAVADYSFSVPKSESVELVIESGKFVNDSGKVVITGTADVTVGATILP